MWVPACLIYFCGILGLLARWHGETATKPRFRIATKNTLMEKPHGRLKFQNLRRRNCTGLERRRDRQICRSPASGPRRWRWASRFWCGDWSLHSSSPASASSCLPSALAGWIREIRHERKQTLKSSPRPMPRPPEELSRRKFLARLSLAVGGVGALILAVPMVGFLVAPLFERQAEVWRSVGKVESFKIGETTAVQYEDASPLPWAGVTARSAAWLRRVNADTFIAFSINCTHLGCPGALARRSQFVHVPVPRRSVLRGWHRRRRPAAVALAALSGARQKRRGADSNVAHSHHQIIMLKRIFHRVWDWVDDRTGLPEVIGKTARHLVPPDAKWWYVFGSATLCAFMVQVDHAALRWPFLTSLRPARPTRRFTSSAMKRRLDIFCADSITMARRPWS